MWMFARTTSSLSRHVVANQLLSQLHPEVLVVHVCSSQDVKRMKNITIGNGHIKAKPKDVLVILNAL